MTPAQIEDDCRLLADAYRSACVARARAEARQVMRPADARLRAARFDAGLAESKAWDTFRDRTRDLMDVAGLPRAAEVREIAVRQAAAAGLAAIKATLREAADAA